MELMRNSTPITTFIADWLMDNRQKSTQLLAQFATKFGKPYSVTANQPIDLNDCRFVWFIESGQIDVFATEFIDGKLRSSHKHIVRLGIGELIFNADEADHSIRLVAKGVGESCLWRIPIDVMLDEMSRKDDADLLIQEVVPHVDSWIFNLTGSVVRDFENRPQIECRLASDIELETGTASVEQGVLWIVADNLKATFLDVVDAGQQKPGVMAISQDSWVKLHSSKGVSCSPSSEIDIEILLTGALVEFHRLALSAESINRKLLLVDDANMQLEQSSYRRGEKSSARKYLFGLTSLRHQPDKAESALEQTLKLIGKFEGITIHSLSLAERREPSLREICEVSGIRARRVRLTQEDRWWLGDSGAMLAYRRKDSHPVALLPGKTGRYRVVDSVTGESKLANEKTTDELENAHVLYPALQGESTTEFTDMFRVAGANLIGDLIRLTVAGTGAGFLALAPAVAIAILVEKVIPAGSVQLLFQFSAILVSIAFVAALSLILRGTALMRLEGRLASRLSSTIWDRLLRLRPSFFNRYSSGELAAKSNIFQDVRDHVSGVTADAVLSTLFLFPAFVILFFFSVELGLTFILLGLTILGITVLFCILQIEPQRHLMASSHLLVGELLQFINGIEKLYLSGAEDSAFAAWARHYREAKKAEIRMFKINEHLIAFSASAPAFVVAVLFTVVVVQGPAGFATADFLAVHTAVMIFCVSTVMLGNSARAIAFIKPACEQVRPILESQVGAGVQTGTRRKLEGEVFFDKVNFAYSNVGATVLNNVSIHAKPGEFIGIVGESGSGKSTIFRLALGLERPCSGAVYFDGKDLNHLDLEAVRRQIGVVPQDTTLQSGSILENIIGYSSDLTVNDAWDAVRQAALEKDILEMPMGLYTIVSETSSTLSGGQCQRIHIAAALVRKTRLFFFDEPTSWLDTSTQAQALKCIEDSTSTRFVIAHRLSTVRKANRIYVLKQGTVVQSGTFEELLATDGYFRKLASRQFL
ncbi:MAG: ATP-binding cassette domain-containing protein [Gammaproteobacteria bacterium]|nr:ATP-binding cassette domain-containing protein [Gammaproteobacteria bacterium]